MQMAPGISVVQMAPWISVVQMAPGISVVQMTPGIEVKNCNISLGYRSSTISGALICHSSANSQNRMKPSGINHVMLLTARRQK